MSLVKKLCFAPGGLPYIFRSPLLEPHHRHAPVAWQHQQLVQKLRGHYAYYGITGNEHRLRRVRWEVIRLWRKWLHRRSQRHRMRWERVVRLLERYPLPRVRIVHTTVGA